ncbi:MAG: intradiol ring-cleavage dioxygenase [Blastocatellia bacterium]
MKSFFALISLSLLLVCNSSVQQQKKIVGGGCDGCEAIFEGMPKSLNWETTIPDAKEPGELLEISGTIYQSDGKTPAANVILYIYHTDAKGHYSPAPGATGFARRNGHLRGWMKTNERGQYKFRSIRPAPYPGRTDPAHIHPIVKEADKNEYYMDEYVFDDDPLVAKEYRAKQENRGGSGITKLTKNQNGIWVGRRDIVLGQNIPNYK